MDAYVKTASFYSKLCATITERRFLKSLFEGFLSSPRRPSCEKHESRGARHEF
jgi:hypothetical protein